MSALGTLAGHRSKVPSTEAHDPSAPDYGGTSPRFVQGGEQEGARDTDPAPS